MNMDIELILWAKVRAFIHSLLRSHRIKTYHLGDYIYSIECFDCDKIFYWYKG